MSAQPTPTALHNDPGQPADPHGYREVLHGLISIGADFARLLHGQATAQAQAAQSAASSAPQNTDAPPAPAPDALISLAAAFDRTARAVRRGILLARSLDAPIQPAADPAQARAATRRRILREVEDAIQRTSSRASDRQDSLGTLQAELRDRLDAPDLDWDISSRPAADIIAEICRDLGLATPPGSTRPWPRRTPADIAQLCALAAAPSAARQPSTCQPGIGPQMPSGGTVQPTPSPQPDQPAAMPCAHPGPIHAGSDPPDAMAGTVAMLLRHPAPLHGRWPPPPQA